MSARSRPVGAIAIPAALGAAALLLVTSAGAQMSRAPSVPDDRFAGLQWTFARVRYSSWAGASGRFRGNPWDQDSWAVDWYAAEDNLSRRLRTVTAIQVNDPVVVTLEDDNLWNYPWLYIVEPGTLRLQEAEVPILREFLLRGGTLTLDDFHGPLEWANVERELKRVFPERTIVELAPDHPIFSCFYTIEAYPQIPGLGSFFSGRTWEKGGFTPHLRAVLDDAGRPMVLINWNTDMGDGWEWSNAEEYPGYLKYTAEAYRMIINEIIYSLTH